jgi:hypothetical protein
MTIPRYDGRAENLRLAHQNYGQRCPRWGGKADMAIYALGDASVGNLKTLPEQEIIRRLRSLRYSSENRANVRGGRKTPLKLLAELAGLHRVTLYRAFWYGRLSERSRAALSPVLIMHTGEGLLPRPPDPPPPQDKLVRAADRNEGSRCRTCGGRRFSPVIMNEAKWFFCDGCLPPAQYPALGARPVD